MRQVLRPPGLVRGNDFTQGLGLSDWLRLGCFGVDPFPDPADTRLVNRANDPVDVRRFDFQEQRCPVDSAGGHTAILAATQFANIGTVRTGVDQVRGDTLPYPGSKGRPVDANLTAKAAARQPRHEALGVVGRPQPCRRLPRGTPFIPDFQKPAQMRLGGGEVTQKLTKHTQFHRHLGRRELENGLGK